MPGLVSTRIELEADALAQLREAITRDAPAFRPRLDGPFEVLELAQAYFPTHRILEVVATSEPARRVVVAMGPVGVRVLTGHVEHLHAMIDVERVHEVLGPRERAAAYAEAAHAWTRAADDELVLDDFSEIPWRTDLDAAAQQQVARLETMYASDIEPAIMRHTYTGWERRFFVVSGQRLIDRRLQIPMDGKLRVEDEVVAEDLPVARSAPSR